VEDISPVIWNNEAYGHLVYDEEQKDLVLTFVENHKRMKAGLDDVVLGKGQGLIFLLSGPPGTGKTLTAEAGKFSSSKLEDIDQHNSKKWPTKPGDRCITSKRKI